MTQIILKIVFLMFPAVIGGIIAAGNSSRIYDAIESAEASLRRWQKQTSASSGWFSSYIFNPVLWVIVKFCDWTDKFSHRRFKNGVLVAAIFYLIAAWLVVLYVAISIALALMVMAAIIYFVFKVMTGSSEDTNEISSLDREYPTYRSNEDTTNNEDVTDYVGLRGKTVYSGTNWFNEELKGRVDDDGYLYKGNNWVNEELIGRIDSDGNIWRGASGLNETIVGRIDKDGTLFKGTNWLNEEIIGRIDKDGILYKGTNWLNEEKQGRTGD
jgi:hypothetical protein